MENSSDLKSMVLQLHKSGVINLYDLIDDVKGIKSEYGLDTEVTLTKAFYIWFEVIKKPRIKHCTLRVYLGVFRNHIFPTFGKTRVRDITSLDLQKFFNIKVVESSRKSEDMKIILNGVFNFCVYNDVLRKNPLKYVYVKKHFRIKGDPLSFQEEQQLLKALHGSIYRIAILIYLYTGCRPTELKTMQFDFENKTILIYNAKLKEYQLNKTRLLPLFPPLIPLQSDILAGKWRFAYSTMDRAFRRFCPAHSLKDLRHTFATKARQFGIDNEIVNVWQGHVQGDNMTATVYTHFSMEYQQQEAQKIKY